MFSKHLFRFAVLSQFCACAAFLNAAPAPASALVECHQTECRDGKITVARQPKLIADDLPSSGLWLDSTTSKTSSPSPMAMWTASRHGHH